eukprot:jgi/Pico_ML_1/52703/g3375.t1
MAALVGKRVHRSTSRGTEAGTVVLYDMERGLYKVRFQSGEEEFYEENETRSMVLAAELVLEGEERPSSEALPPSSTTTIRKRGRPKEEFNRAWESWIDPEHLPARSLVEGRLIRPEYMVEVQITAVVPRPKALVEEEAK